MKELKSLEGDGKDSTETQGTREREERKQLVCVFLPSGQADVSFFHPYPHSHRALAPTM